MKIHTTQNLGSLEKRNSTNNVAQNELRLSRLYEENSRSMFNSKDSNMTIVSFRGSKPNSKDAKKVIDSAKKLVGEIKKSATPEVEKGDKFLLSSFFNALLKVADYETALSKFYTKLANVSADLSKNHTYMHIQIVNSEGFVNKTEIVGTYVKE